MPKTVPLIALRGTRAVLSGAPRGKASGFENLLVGALQWIFSLPL